MIIKPKIRGFVCTTAHPTGCAEHVMQQINYVKSQGKLENMPKKVLVIGASTGYGLASRIVAAFGGHAQTIGVFFEKPASEKRTASAGWYNTAAFEQAAQKEGLYAKSINGDAFSDTIKQETIDLIQQDWQDGVDCVIYSLASPRRIHPKTGKIFNSSLKAVNEDYTNNTLDVFKGELKPVTIGPATEEEIENTVAVMGGEDWQLWIDALLEANALAQGAITLAYNYIGPEITYPIYHHGTIGHAKAHLVNTARALNEKLQAAIGGQAFISVNKAVVTQASAAIPVVPLYMSILLKIMKEKDLHENCVEQIWRLFHDKLYGSSVELDEQGLIRLDDWEMREDIQKEVMKRWEQVGTKNLEEISDLSGYRHEFYQLFGFDIETVNYQEDVDTELNIPSVNSV